MMGRWIDEEDVPARVGELGTFQSMMMTPGAIAAELARINTSFVGHNNELLTAARAHGLNDPSFGAASVSGWWDAIKDLVALNPGQAAVEIAHTIQRDQAPGQDQVTKTTLDAASRVSNTLTSTDPVVRLFVDGWVPLWNTWKTFFSQERDGAWFHNAAYDAEKYLDGLVQIRAQAEALGVHFRTPKPTEEHGASSWFPLVKYGLIGAGVLGGLWVVSKFVGKGR